MAVSKKKVIKSLENLSEELKELIRDQYPNGYEGSITRITSPKKEPLFVFPLETDDATYLIKVPVTKNSDGEYDVESNPETEFEAGATPPAGAAPDDFDNSNDDEDEERSSYRDRDDEEDDYDGRRKSREGSYDPDFDN